MRRLILAMLCIAALTASASAQSDEPFGMSPRQDQGGWWGKALKKFWELDSEKMDRMIQGAQVLRGTERLNRVRMSVIAQLPNDCAIQTAAMHAILILSGTPARDMRVVVGEGSGLHTMLAVRDGQEWLILDNGSVVKGAGVPRWQEVKNFRPEYLFD